jgi:AGZA family xanthine/uracil permease-like MFS transporter
MSALESDAAARGTLRSSRTGYGPSGWATSGDLNAFFGLMLDNIGDMILMAGLLVGVYGFPAEFVLTQMIPGTAVGVMVGDLIYTWMAFRLARREGRKNVTAMPLGLDTPSTFGAVFLILGPAYRGFLSSQERQGLTPDPVAAAHHAWFLGITILLVSGVFKLGCATVSGWIRRTIPRAGLLGSLVSIALVIISFQPLVEFAATPIAGFVSLFIILATLTARWELTGRSAMLSAAACAGFVAFAVARIEPSLLGTVEAGVLALIVAVVFYGLVRRARQVPGVLMAVLMGCVITYALYWANLGPGPEVRPGASALSLPFPMIDWLSWIRLHWAEALTYLPVAIPLALATVVGGIDCAESAAAAGDDYPTGPIVAAEGFATLIGGVFGGVIQSTPYIGHPAYKAMGGRAGYTLATALFVGAAGVLGFFGWIFHILPRAAVFPILVFVGIEITQQTFRATARRHYPALVLACLPALALLASLVLDRLIGEIDRVFAQDNKVFTQLAPEIQQWIQTITILSAGFIVTSLLWGSSLARLIDGHWKTAAALQILCAAFAFVGVIHSPLPGSPIGWPWDVVARLDELGRLEASRTQTPYHWSLAYLAIAGTLALVGLSGKIGPPEPDLIPPEPGADSAPPEGVA